MNDTISFYMRLKKMAEGLEGIGKGFLPGRPVARHITIIKKDQGFIKSDPNRDIRRIGFYGALNITLKKKDGIRIGPSAAMGQPLRQRKMIERDHGLNIA